MMALPTPPYPTLSQKGIFTLYSSLCIYRIRTCTGRTFFQINFAQNGVAAYTWYNLNIYMSKRKLL